MRLLPGGGNRRCRVSGAGLTVSARGAGMIPGFGARGSEGVDVLAFSVNGVLALPGQLDRQTKLTRSTPVKPRGGHTPVMPLETDVAN